MNPPGSVETDRLVKCDRCAAVAFEASRGGAYEARMMGALARGLVLGHLALGRAQAQCATDELDAGLLRTLNIVDASECDGTTTDGKMRLPACSCWTLVLFIVSSPRPSVQDRTVRATCATLASSAAPCRAERNRTGRSRPARWSG